MLNPYVSELCYVPLDAVDSISHLKKSLTLLDYDMFSGESKSIECFSLAKKGYIGIPRTIGQKSLSDKFNFEDKTVINSKSSFDSQVIAAMCGAIKARNPEQQEFMNDLELLCANHTQSPIDFIANASTGSGKSVTMLWLIARLPLPALIVVPTIKLMHQFLGSIERENGMRYFFGEDFVNDYVGIVQQDTCDYVGKYIVVASMCSLAQRYYGKQFYENFSVVFFDEVHKTAAPQMQRVLSKFPARIRGGFTATNKKGDLKKICEFHLGTPKAISTQEQMAPNVYIYTYKRMVRLFGSSDSQKLASLCMLKDRNSVIANIVYERGYLRKRNIVILSDKVKQLQNIQQLLIDKGIDKKDVGLYVGAYYPKTPKGFGTKTIKTLDSELERIASDCSIILATYAIFSTGTDIPRLDMGVEASPRTDLVQAIGRITRLKKNKLTPEWYSLKDVITFSVETCGKTMLRYETKYLRQHKARIKSYLIQKAKIFNVTDNI